MDVQRVEFMHERKGSGIMDRDGIIILGMLVSVVAGIFGACQNRQLYFKVASCFLAAGMCLGLAYFGWRPFFGGQHGKATYFGCFMLSSSVILWLINQGISSSLSKLEDQMKKAKNS